LGFLNLDLDLDFDVDMDMHAPRVEVHVKVRTKTEVSVQEFSASRHHNICRFLQIMKIAAGFDDILGTRIPGRYVLHFSIR